MASRLGVFESKARQYKTENAELRENLEETEALLEDTSKKKADALAELDRMTNRAVEHEQRSRRAQAERAQLGAKLQRALEGLEAAKKEVATLEAAEEEFMKSRRTVGEVDGLRRDCEDLKAANEALQQQLEEAVLAAEDRANADEATMSALRKELDAFRRAGTESSAEAASVLNAAQQRIAALE